jgi:hypothetical protein
MSLTIIMPYLIRCCLTSVIDKSYKLCFPVVCLEVSGFHVIEISSRDLLGYDAVKWCGRISTFRRTLLPPSSDWRADSGSKVLGKVSILPYHYMAPEDGGSKVLRNSDIFTISLHLKMEAARSFETVISLLYHCIWRWRQQGPPKQWYLYHVTTRRHNPGDRDLSDVYCTTCHKKFIWLVAYTVSHEHFLVIDFSCRIA